MSGTCSASSCPSRRDRRRESATTPAAARAGKNPDGPREKGDEGNQEGRILSSMPRGLRCALRGAKRGRRQLTRGECLNPVPRRVLRDAALHACDARCVSKLSNLVAYAT